MVYIIPPVGGPGGDKSIYATGGDAVASNGKYVLSLSRLVIRSGHWIDAIQLEFTRNDGYRFVSPLYGGTGGDYHDFFIHPDHYIVGIRGWYDRYIDNIEIMMSNPLYNVRFGGLNTRYSYKLEAPAGFEVCGFIGRYGRYLDSLGLALRRRK